MLVIFFIIFFSILILYQLFLAISGKKLIEGLQTNNSTTSTINNGINQNTPTTTTPLSSATPTTPTTTTPSTTTPSTTTPSTTTPSTTTPSTTTPSTITPTTTTPTSQTIVKPQSNLTYQEYGNDTMILSEKNAGNIEFLKSQVNDLSNQVSAIASQQAVFANKIASTQPLNITGT